MGQRHKPGDLVVRQAHHEVLRVRPRHRSSGATHPHHGVIPAKAGIHPDALPRPLALWRIIRMDPDLRRGDTVVGGIGVESIARSLGHRPAHNHRRHSRARGNPSLGLHHMRRARGPELDSRVRGNDAVGGGMMVETKNILRCDLDHPCE